MQTKGCPVENVLGIREDSRCNADVVTEMQVLMPYQNRKVGVPR
jgi:hypothetical protein